MYGQFLRSKKRQEEEIKLRNLYIEISLLCINVCYTMTYRTTGKRNNKLDVIVHWQKEIFIKNFKRTKDGLFELWSCFNTKKRWNRTITIIYIITYQSKYRHLYGCFTYPKEQMKYPGQKKLNLFTTMHRHWVGCLKQLETCYQHNPTKIIKVIP